MRAARRNGCCSRASSSNLTESFATAATQYLSIRRQRFPSNSRYPIEPLGWPTRVSLPVALLSLD